MPLQAVFFDQDGVIIDTERDGHRVAFNRTFEAFGLPVHWDVAAYHELLQIGGGKERMRHDLKRRGLPVSESSEQLDTLIAELHAAKTHLFIQMIESGELPLRPGVLRLMREIKEAGLLLGICTTSHSRTADAVCRQALGGVAIDFVLAGDVVAAKKPDPAIYHLALERAAVPCDAAVVIEDSQIGVSAAVAAGLRVVATRNGYTMQEDLSGAALVVENLGEPSHPSPRVGGWYDALDFDGVVGLETLRDVAEVTHPSGVGQTS